MFLDFLLRGNAAQLDVESADCCPVYVGAVSWAVFAKPLFSCYVFYRRLGWNNVQHWSESALKIRTLNSRLEEEKQQLILSCKTDYQNDYKPECKTSSMSECVLKLVGLTSELWNGNGWSANEASGF